VPRFRLLVLTLFGVGCTSMPPEPVQPVVTQAPGLVVSAVPVSLAPGDTGRIVLRVDRSPADSLFWTFRGSGTAQFYARVRRVTNSAGRAVYTDSEAIVWPSNVFRPDVRLFTPLLRTTMGEAALEAVSANDDPLARGEYEVTVEIAIVAITDSNLVVRRGVETDRHQFPVRLSVR
jgi:hypothetical protein